MFCRQPKIEFKDGMTGSDGVKGRTMFGWGEAERDIRQVSCCFYKVVRGQKRSLGVKHHSTEGECGH